MQIADNILQILSACQVEGNILYLPKGQLDRKTYEAVNKCLVNIGGHWDRKYKGHVFDYDPGDALDNMLLTGETVNIKKIYQFFPTPRMIAEQMCDMAEFFSTAKVLEPSCGKGDLMDVIYGRGITDLLGIEINRDMERYLKDKSYKTLVGIDFISEFAEDKNIRHDWTHIVMNPPFAKQQDVSHIWAAYSILNPGGVLVSIVSPSPFFRTNKTSIDFRTWIDEVGAEVIDVPEGAFKESGTLIRTKIIKVRKRAA